VRELQASCSNSVSSCSRLSWSRTMPRPTSLSVSSAPSTKDLLVLYTDAVTEAFDASGNELGRSVCSTVYADGRHLPVGSLLDSIVHEVQTFNPTSSTTTSR
jgi:hypothetical protein